MLSEPSLKSTTLAGSKTSNDIPIDTTGSDLNLFLDYKHNREVNAAKDWTSYERLLRLFDQLGCDIAIDRIVLHLFDHAELAPWATFCLASQLNKPKLAQEALEHMSKDRTGHVDHRLRYEFELGCRLHHPIPLRSIQGDFFAAFGPKTIFPPTSDMCGLDVRLGGGIQDIPQEDERVS